MEVYQMLTVNIASVSQAGAFADAFLEVFGGDMDLCEEELLPALETFRREGGCLHLEEFMLRIAGSCLEEYKRIFLRTAQADPDAAFTACTGASGDVESLTRFSYAEGCLHWRYLSAPEGMAVAYCPSCGVDFPEVIALEDWLNAEVREVCPSCGCPPFDTADVRLDAGCLPLGDADEEADSQQL